MLALTPAAVARPHNPNLARAQAAYTALQRYLFVPTYSLYKGATPTTYSNLWPFSQALAASVSMSELPGGQRAYGKAVEALLRGLARYWEPAATPPGYGAQPGPPLGNYGTIGYDDNEWVALELLRRYRATRSRALVTRAGQLFDLAVSGWDTNPAHACPGGVLFSESPHNSDRNTVTNAPAVQLGARLYMLTHRVYYLTWAKRFYDWVRGCLVGAGGLYIDHIGFGGDRDATIWSYNQGTMVGAGALLYEATRHRSYLAHAVANARAAVAYFDDTRLTGDPPFFVAIFVDNLMLLDAIRHDPGYRARAQYYASWAWSSIRDRANVFPFDTGGGQVLEQAAMTRIYATLAGAAP